MNLIICSSPFQVLVAKKIIERFPNKSFYGFMLIVADNEKYHHYAQELIKSCQGNGDSYILKKNKKPLLVILDLLLLKLKGLNIKNVENIYLASFDSILIQTFISALRFKELYTFDDGTANIVKDSYYYNQDRHSGVLTRLLKMLFGNPYDVHSLKKISKKHYTVFLAKNIIDNTDYLPFFTIKNNKNTSFIDKKIIMIGQPIYEMYGNLSKAQIKQKNLALTQKIIQQFKIQYYLPHPRENYQVSNVQYIQTPLVAEDYFCQSINQETHYTIYTFCSGAVLPFVGLDNVTIISILPHDCPKNLLSGYELMQEFGISVINIDGN